ncbi:MAG: YtxH domain-containing protein [Fimbriimonadales bacterium]|nr:YtxH domain-containing protein [Fimbriimonadales bacterium]
MQNHDERSGVLYLLAGIGLGVLIGAVIGLLFAPKSGEELRGDLSQRLHDLSEKVRELSHQLSERAGEVGRNLRERVSRKAHEVAEEIAPEEA